MMFYPSEMNRITIGLHRAYTQDAIRALHETGVMEIINIRDPGSHISLSVNSSLRPEMAEQCIEYKIQIGRAHV